uniref:Uncharacterized protein n=1 Tax=Magallana gigas TaxID=29159 RepID=K1QDF6_MAGGI
MSSNNYPYIVNRKLLYKESVDSGFQEPIEAKLKRYGVLGMLKPTSRTHALQNMLYLLKTKDFPLQNYKTIKIGYFWKLYIPGHAYKPDKLD